MPTEPVHAAVSNGNGHASFSELVRAHYALDVNEAEDPEAAERRFRALLASFESGAGEIVDAYWCRKEASAVALTWRERWERRGLLSRRRLDYRLHRVSDWVTTETHELADLLHDCDILAIKAAAGLERIPRAVVMQWLLLVESHLLGFIERHRDTRPTPEAVAHFARQERAELRRIEDYYFRAGEKRARLRYVEGMFGIGLILVLLAALATAGVLELFGVLDLGDARVREFYVCTAGGAVGALVSVLMRMSGRGSFVIDHELGRWEVVAVGAYRPIVGAVSGIVVYFLVQTTILPLDDTARTFPFYVVASFLAGFSERWTRMVLDGAMRTIGDAPEPAPARDEAAEQPTAEGTSEPPAEAPAGRPADA